MALSFPAGDSHPGSAVSGLFFVSVQGVNPLDPGNIWMLPSHPSQVMQLGTL
jgi:hypothetical protein